MATTSCLPLSPSPALARRPPTRALCFSLGGSSATTSEVLPLSTTTPTRGLGFRPRPLPLNVLCLSVGKRIKSAFLWVITTAIVCALVLGILCGLIGKVDFTVRHLSSSTTLFPSTWGFSGSQPCIGSGTHQCSVYSASSSSETTWTMRTTFPEYVVALATIVGSIFFTIFGGVGIASLPLGLIYSLIRRPKAVITRSKYIKEAIELGKKARELRKVADALHQEERSGSKGRKWHKNVKSVEKPPPSTASSFFSVIHDLIVLYHPP
ncbi:LIMR family protein At5g01460-like [Malania oleifera]|uniref:LIMR family protein At5g01460-like n=1 Tax=Malania oleifera TaxID=397392 RepID=UPI0025AE0FAF|nr:LIMR family protein At5g01460-like [Malania oleifera]